MSSLYAADIDITVYAYKDYTIFNYIFKFDEFDNFNKFSIEKPEDAQLDYIVNQNGPVDYSIAGDYYIFKPDEVRNNTFLLKYKSEKISKEISSTEAFKTYLNFNFPVEKLELHLLLKDDFGEIINVFPQNHTISEKGKITWETNNMMDDSLYIVNFKTTETIENQYFLDNINYFFSFLILLSIIIIFFFRKYLQHLKSKITELYKEKNKNKNKDISNKEIHNTEFEQSNNKITAINNKNKQTSNTINQKTNNNIKNHNIDFDEIIDKHLTENEKKITKLIKQEEGISQNDILHSLPQLTKSNLSKIISKLHSNRFLKRIKVGKTNKIYLGEKLKKE